LPPSLAATPRRRRRIVAAAGLLVPALLLAMVSAYVVLGFGAGCGDGTPAHTGSCAGSSADVAVVTFPIALVCAVLGAAVLRGARWSRWPAVVSGAVLATVVTAGALAGVVAIGADGTDTRGAVVLGVLGLALAAVCAMPAALLSGARGAAAFPPQRA